MIDIMVLRTEPVISVSTRKMTAIVMMKIIGDQVVIQEFPYFN